MSNNTTQKSPYIGLVNVSKYYNTHSLLRRQKIPVINNMSFSVRQGECFAIIGSSGAGKSTVGKLLLGLTSPDEGVVYYQDMALPEILKNKKAWFRKQCQAIFQDPKASLSPRMQIIEILSETLSLDRDLPKKDHQDIIIRQLQLLGIESEQLNKYPHQLSGGEAQRICIARALLRKPELLICDEPTSGLDVVTEWEIIHLLKALQETGKLTLIFMTHNLHLLPHIADRAGIVHQGVMIETGDIKTIINNPEQTYTQKLVQSITYR
ncbi:MAG TPA: ABC transporter ATP-binding protein [bacterium]|nr:ABC transporter ATP-binding protein [bacterium]HPN44803.1 ABC transporter ATP-binding protein [bacterium]